MTQSIDVSFSMWNVMDSLGFCSGAVGRDHCADQERTVTVLCCWTKLIYSPSFIVLWLETNRWRWNSFFCSPHSVFVERFASSASVLIGAPSSTINPQMKLCFQLGYFCPALKKKKSGSNQSVIWQSAWAPYFCVTLFTGSLSSSSRQWKALITYWILCYYLLKPVNTHALFLQKHFHFDSSKRTTFLGRNNRLLPRGL